MKYSALKKLHYFTYILKHVSSSHLKEK